MLIFVSYLETPAQGGGKTSLPNTWKDFVSDEGGFKVKMPLAPARVTSKIDMAFGKADLIQYRVLTASIAYIVSYVVFPSVIPDAEEINARYDLIRAGMLSVAGNKLVSERNVYVGEHLGKELVINAVDSTQSVRAFIVGPRLFSLYVFTKPGERAKHQSSINRFFDSFQLTNIPKAEYEVVRLPDDFGSKITGKTYTSSFFGFSIDLPKTWRILSDDEMAGVREIISNEAEINDSKADKITKLSLKRTVFLVGTATPQASLLVAAERLDFANMDAELTMKVVKTNQLLRLDNKLVRDVYSVMLGGVQFLAIDLQNVSTGVKQRFLLAIRRGLAFQIVLTYTSAETLREMEQSLNTAAFNTK